MTCADAEKEVVALRALRVNKINYFFILFFFCCIDQWFLIIVEILEVLFFIIDFECFYFVIVYSGKFLQLDHIIITSSGVQVVICKFDFTTFY